MGWVVSSCVSACGKKKPQPGAKAFANTAETNLEQAPKSGHSEGINAESNPTSKDHFAARSGVDHGTIPPWESSKSLSLYSQEDNADKFVQTWTSNFWLPICSWSQNNYDMALANPSVWGKVCHWFQVMFGSNSITQIANIEYKIVLS